MRIMKNLSILRAAAVGLILTTAVTPQAVGVTLSSVTTVYSDRATFVSSLHPFADYGTFSFSRSPAVNNSAGALTVIGDGANAVSQEYGAKFTISGSQFLQQNDTIGGSAGPKLREDGGIVVTTKATAASAGTAKVTIDNFGTTDPSVLEGVGPSPDGYDTAIAFGIDVHGIAGTVYTYTALFGDYDDGSGAWASYTDSVTIPVGGTAFLGFVSPVDTLQSIAFFVPSGSNIAFDNMVFGEAVPFSPAGTVGAGVAMGLLWLRRKRG